MKRTKEFDSNIKSPPKSKMKEIHLERDIILIFHKYTNISDRSTQIKALLDDNPDVGTLDLSFRQITDEWVMAICKALDQNSSVKILSLRGNWIGPKGAIALSDMLAKNENLQILNLYANAIGLEGTQAIASALAQNRSLQVLNLGCNMINYLGASALSSALIENKSLRNLKLDHNQLGHKAAVSLSRALAKNRSLYKLSLNVNELGNHGALAISSGLAENQSLHTLCLEDNKINTKCAPEFSASIKENFHLLRLFEPSLSGYVKTYIDRNHRRRIPITLTFYILIIQQRKLFDETSASPEFPRLLTADLLGKILTHTFARPTQYYATKLVKSVNSFFATRTLLTIEKKKQSQDDYQHDLLNSKTTLFG